MLTINSGKPVAIIRGGKRDEMVIKLNTNVPQNTQSIPFFSQDGTFEPIPEVDENKGDRIFIAGQTGCGKTTWCSMYISNYIIRYPDAKIYVFSDVDEDRLLDSFSPIRVPIAHEAIDSISPETLGSSLCIFDDIDSIRDKKLRQKVEALRDAILKRGRHERVYTLCTSHILMNGWETKSMIDICSKIVFFPSCGNRLHPVRLMNIVLGIDMKTIKTMLASRPKWIMLHKDAPYYYLSPNVISMIK